MKNNYSLTIFILTLILSILLIRLEILYLKNNSSVQTSAKIINSGFAIEPQTPVNIDDPPHYSTPLPKNEVSIQ